MADADIDRILEARTIAVVGLSSNPLRHSHEVSAYMQDHGYRIVPVNPNETEVLGEKAYPDLASVPFDVDIVNVFRRSEHLAGVVEQAIRNGARGVWAQLGVVDPAAEAAAREAGLDFVMDECIMVEHARRRRAGGREVPA
jgi:predicted CoA-binding protein